MRELFQEIAVEALIIVLHESLDAELYFSCDAANNRGVHHTIKGVSFYDAKKIN